MANNSVNFILNITGNAQSAINNITKATQIANVTVNKFQSSISKLRDAGLAFDAVNNSVGKLTSALGECQDLYNIQAQAEKKLETVMRQRINATDEEIQSIKNLASAQQMLGVIGDEVQLSGAQQLATFVNQTDSLEKLLPAMNNLLAQQKGLNATELDAVNIGNLMGKVLQGQVGALTRVGISFTAAQEKVLKYGTEQQRAAMLAQVITDNVGNMNEALAATPEGALKQASNNIGDIKERVGAIWVDIQAKLLPVMQRGIEILSNLIGWIEKNKTAITVIGVAIGTLIAALKSMAFILTTYQMVMSAVTVCTTLWTGAQTVLNAILTANPIGLIIVAIGALIAVVALIIKKYDEWGAAISLMLGPIGLLINAIMAIKNNWDSIVDAFQSDGIMAGIKRIGTVLLDAVLYPVQQLLEILSKIPGMANLATSGVDKIAKIRENLNLATPTKAASATGGNSQLVSAVNATGSNTKLQGGEIARSSQAIATGGTRNTQITINLSKMVESIIFNGGVSENKEDMVSQVEEALARVLLSAQSAV